MPHTISLTRFLPRDDSTEALQITLDRFCEAAKQVPGTHRPTLWRHVTGGEWLAIVLYETAEAMSGHVEAMTCSDRLVEFIASLEDAPNVDAFKVVFHTGSRPEEVPLDGYVSMVRMDRLSGPDPTVAAQASIAALAQIDGFLGAYVGQSEFSPDWADSLVFWRDHDAAEKAIPIRVEASPTFYRRIL